MQHINEIEQDLIKNGYWKLSKGYKRNGEMTDPVLMTTPKWSKMVMDLLKPNPHKIITPEMVSQYIMNLDAD